jgi:hypothetical protein
MSTQHNGARAPEDFSNSPAISHLSHGLAASIPARHDRTGNTPNLARDAGKAKDIRPTPYTGATASQIAHAGRGGIGHPTATTVAAGGEPVSSASKNPLADAPPPSLKHGVGVPASFGMKGAVNHELASEVLAETIKSGGIVPRAPDCK